MLLIAGWDMSPTLWRWAAAKEATGLNPNPAGNPFPSALTTPTPLLTALTQTLFCRY